MRRCGLARSGTIASDRDEWHLGAIWVVVHRLRLSPTWTDGDRRRLVMSRAAALDEIGHQTASLPIISASVGESPGSDSLLYYPVAMLTLKDLKSGLEVIYISLFFCKKNVRRPHLAVNEPPIPLLPVVKSELSSPTGKSTIDGELYRDYWRLRVRVRQVAELGPTPKNNLLRASPRR